jgi:cysteinyl-tRNA synthetase
MAATYLDGELDIHGGGADLIFPHHENEIAQSEAYLGHEPFSRYWVHNGLLQFGGDKMSKSIGNMVRIKEILERGLGMAFRLMVLQSHYRAPLTYTEEGLVAADRGLDRLRAAASAVSVPSADGERSTSEDLLATVRAVRFRFEAAMDDDFDSPGAIAALFDLGRAINRAAANGVDQTVVSAASAELIALAGILGLRLDDKPQNAAVEAKPFIELLIEVREQLRTAKQWQLADAIRDGLKERGIAIEDGSTGATWKTTSSS